MRYQVTVGNIGTVIDTDDKGSADRIFDQYKADSLTGVGRAGGESVTLFDQDLIGRHHQGTIDLED